MRNQGILEARPGIRIVSLCPSITKLIFDLKCGDLLSGVTKYCIHPPEGVAPIPKVGGTKNPDLREILGLKPDLVLMNAEENRQEDWVNLKREGITCHVSYPITLDETIETVLDIGARLGVTARAQRLAAVIRRARENAARTKSGRSQIKWAYLIWRKPWMTVNRGTYIHALLSEAGGVNVFGDSETAYPAVTDNQIAAASPDRVFLSTEPFPFKEKHRHELAAATAMPADRFQIVDGMLLSWHCAYTAAGLEYAVRIMAGNRSDAGAL